MPGFIEGVAAGVDPYARAIVSTRLKQVEDQQRAQAQLGLLRHLGVLPAIQQATSPSEISRQLEEQVASNPAFGGQTTDLNQLYESQGPSQSTRSLANVLSMFGLRGTDVGGMELGGRSALTGLNSMFPIITVNPATGEAQNLGMAPHGAKILSAGQAGMTPQSDVAAVAQGIKSGQIPPDAKQVSFRDRTRVNAILAKEGIDLSKLQTDWNTIQRHAQSANSTQQLRMRQALASVQQSVPALRELSQDFQRAGWTPANAIELRAALTGTAPVQLTETATKFLVQMNLMRDELAQGFMGGGVPTNEAFKLADEVLNPVYGSKQLGAALDQLETNLSIRMNAIESTPPISVGGAYSPQYSQYGQPSGTRQAPSQHDSMIQTLEAQGYKFKGVKSR